MSNQVSSNRGCPAPFAVAVCALAGALGFFLGKPTTPPSTGNATAESTVLKAAVSAPKPQSIAGPVVHPGEGSPAWDDRWRTANARASNPARTRALAALIEELARIDHDRALALAAANDNWRLRDILRAAALRGWAAVAPDAAGDFALSLRPEDRRAAVAAVLQGAVGAPDETVRLALRLCQADPAPAGDYGHAAIAALVDVGAFAEAVKFGNEIGVEKHPYLWKSAFFQWSRNQPDEALAACAAIEDPELRARAQGEVTSGWAWADPKGLAEHAIQLPSGEERNRALNEALPLWIEREPDAAINWINTQEAGPEFDAGVAAVANLQSFVIHQPGTAMDLAIEISEPALRKQTMRGVFRQWAQADATGARAYAAAREDAADRALLENELEDLAP